MREFFRGWRRKAGVVTLVMACVSMCMWIRGRVFIEGALFDTGNRQCNVVLNFKGKFYWCRWTRPDEEENHHWIHQPVALAAPFQRELDFLKREQGSWRLSIPLMPSALLLTLLSAYLFLWKPRKLVCAIDADGRHGLQRHE
jgi:hypothetical protein